MLESRGKDWGDKVRLIGLSIDNDAGTVKNHIESKDWKNVEHYHVRTAGCTADKEYGVNGVPHVLLVDTKGKIVFMGHPASRQIEKDIDNLLKGEVLQGAGTSGGTEEVGEATGASPSNSEAEEAITKFKADSKKFNEDNHTACQGM